MKELMIGVDVGGTNIRCGVVSEKGIISIDKEKIINKKSKDKINSQIINIIRKSFSSGIKGIGIGVPSIIDLKKGIIKETFNLPAWQNVPLKRILERKFHVPVRINNDAKCFALGEKHFGSAKKHSNIVAAQGQDNRGLLLREIF
ncbi:ROK family protein [Candidatus Woesearchaeota archaeon]|nr:ROK family protein [Candidatus Woesearchaeota archaeon]